MSQRLSQYLASIFNLDEYELEEAIRAYEMENEEDLSESDNSHLAEGEENEVLIFQAWNAGFSSEDSREDSSEDSREDSEDDNEDDNEEYEDIPSNNASYNGSENGNDKRENKLSPGKGAIANEISQIKENEYDEDFREKEELKERWNIVKGFAKQFLNVEVSEYENQTPTILFWELLGYFRDEDEFFCVKLHWICCYFYGFVKRYPEIRSACKEYINIIVKKMKDIYGIHISQFIGEPSKIFTPLHGIDVYDGKIRATNVSC